MWAVHPCRWLAPLAALCALLALRPAAAVGPPPAAPPRAQVARLISELGAVDAALRREAARRLTALPHVPHALRRAAASDDDAAPGRAAPALKALERRLAPVVLVRAAAWAKAGEVDLVREAAYRWGPKATGDAGAGRS